MITKSDLLAVDDEYKAWLLEDGPEYEDTPILDARKLERENTDKGRAMKLSKRDKINNKEAEYGPDL